MFSVICKEESQILTLHRPLVCVVRRRSNFHLQFSVKSCAAALLGEVVCSLVFWPGTTTSVNPMIGCGGGVFYVPSGQAEVQLPKILI